VKRKPEIIVTGTLPDAAVAAALRTAPGSRFVSAGSPGAAHAWNAGLRAATGDVVLFTAADARPEDGWADALLRRFEGPEVMLAGGLVLPSDLTTDAQVASYIETGLQWHGFKPLAFDSGFLDGWRRGPPILQIGAAANMAVRREAALRVGGFDATARSAAAPDLWMRLLRAGGEARYEPLAVVRQSPPETWEEVGRSVRERSRAQVAALLLAHGRHSATGALIGASLAQPRRALGRLVRAGQRWRHGESDQLVGATLLGFAEGYRHIGSAIRRRPGYAAPPLRARDAEHDA
jgi:hypothetical protein